MEAQLFLITFQKGNSMVSGVLTTQTQGPEFKPKTHTHTKIMCIPELRSQRAGAMGLHTTQLSLTVKIKTSDLTLKARHVAPESRPPRLTSGFQKHICRCGHTPPRLIQRNTKKKNLNKDVTTLTFRK